MNQPTPPTKLDARFEALAWDYLDQTITETDFNELQKRLEENATCRKRLQWLAETNTALSEQTKLGPDALTELPAPNKLFRFPTSGGWRLAAGIVIAVIVVLQLTSDPSLKVKLIAERDADWRGAALNENQTASTRLMHLMRGTIALNFPGKTDVIIEGPAIFQVQDNQTIEVTSGTVNVHHQGKPGAFKLITPVGEFVDLGTKFAVKIGHGVTDSIVMTEVHEGEVVFSNTRNSNISLTDGDAYAFVGNQQHNTAHPEIDGRKVRVAETFALTSSGKDLKSLQNLALGKPVTTPTYYNNPESGEVFPAAALTDGRLNDSGSPWDWSFWLAPNGQAGSFTVDLLTPQTISRVDFMNTRNRHHNDRGLEAFRLEVSIDGEHFEPVLSDTLQRVGNGEEDNYNFAFETFTFPQVSARYVRVIGLSHYSHSIYPDADPYTSGGLNEIRVYE